MPAIDAVASSYQDRFEQARDHLADVEAALTSATSEHAWLERQAAEAGVARATAERERLENGESPWPGPQAAIRERAQREIEQVGAAIANAAAERERQRRAAEHTLRLANDPDRERDRIARVERETLRIEMAIESALGARDRLEHVLRQAEPAATPAVAFEPVVQQPAGARPGSAVGLSWGAAPRAESGVDLLIGSYRKAPSALRAEPPDASAGNVDAFIASYRQSPAAAPVDPAPEPARPAERGRSSVGAWLLLAAVAVLVLALAALRMLAGLPLVVAIVAVAAGLVAAFVSRRPAPRGG
ncbi:MAG: hypothetical protein ACYC9W_03245 [Candidatus Limnocylindria bacterium]